MLVKGGGGKMRGLRYFGQGICCAGCDKDIIFYYRGDMVGVGD